MTSFVVSNVTAGATAITVYKKMGADTPVVVGTKTTGIVAGNNTVTLTGGTTLEKNVTLFATQTVSGQEGCPNSPGYQVGIGNSQVQFTFNMRAEAPGRPHRRRRHQHHLQLLLHARRFGQRIRQPDGGCGYLPEH